MSFLNVKTAVHGYRVYQVVREPPIGDLLVAPHERGNDHDRHTMAVYLDEEPVILVGYLPWEVSKICQLFCEARWGINGKVTGPRRYSEISGAALPIIREHSVPKNLRCRMFRQSLISNIMIIKSSSPDDHTPWTPLPHPLGVQRDLAHRKDL